ncbi:MAG: cation:dicarboxylase symporter family transporter [Phenylobacterium sp.]|uniref:dicarboxylate/amino acid:cation symporter n=1 Tax=Phenylobacterium sp. TaxID=1871053 RepID=UPI001A3EC65F|nr:cation:dicarboxylase symporter family transporter [Phenylobacterium sp.]MBL8553850.1 cation:dicarboxylase symporter family transporter [Phenylobacterium sp.]
MKFLKSLSLQVLIALTAGLVVGAVAAASGGPGAAGVIESIESLGGLWLNALRMTVVPLIFAVLVTGIAQVADAAATGRLAVRAVIWFGVLLLISALFSVAWCNGLLALWPVDETAAAALRAGAGAASEAPPAPDFAAWVRGLAPSNPLKAASEDQILPLVVFAVFTGFAITRLQQAAAQSLVAVFQALGDAMIVIVRWVLMAAPVGVFCLALGVGLRTGAGAAGIIGQYMVVAASAGAMITLLGYVMAVTVARVPFGRWARATAPVLATAFATQSSLACLPAMIERARDELDVPEPVANLILPLAVAIFRMTSPAVNLAVCIFIAHVYGIQPSPAQYTSGILVALAMGVGSIGLPGQVSFIISVAPICAALNLPIELLPILLAVEVVPDIFRTLGNVTNDMAVTSVLARGEEKRAAAASSQA